jgi:hypothetical protein
MTLPNGSFRSASRYLLLQLFCNSLL